MDSEQNKKNRKQRRFEKMLARRKKPYKDRPTVKDAVQATIRQMRESTRVQELVVSGKLDKYLD